MHPCTTARTAYTRWRIHASVHITAVFPAQALALAHMGSIVPIGLLAQVCIRAIVALRDRQARVSTHSSAPEALQRSISPALSRQTSTYMHV
jgi:hypothetical protein